MKKYLLLVVIFLSSHGALQAAPKGEGVEGQGNTVKRMGNINAAPGTPTRAILDIEDKMKSYKTQKPLSAADEVYNAKIKHDIIQGSFDLRELCRRSLDKHWDQRSGAEQDQFVNLMSRILEKKALFTSEQSKTRGKKYVVNYRGDNFLQGSMAVSKIHIRTQDNNEINIQYRFRKVGGQWRIYDVVVDDASLVDNYRYQFDSIIKKYGYGELVNRMNKKLMERDE